MSRKFPVRYQPANGRNGTHIVLEVYARVHQVCIPYEQEVCRWKIICSRTRKAFQPHGFFEKCCTISARRVSHVSGSQARIESQVSKRWCARTRKIHHRSSSVTPAASSSGCLLARTSLRICEKHARSRKCAFTVFTVTKGAVRSLPFKVKEGFDCGVTDSNNVDPAILATPVSALVVICAGRGCRRAVDSASYVGALGSSSIACS